MVGFKPAREDVVGFKPARENVVGFNQLERM